MTAAARILFPALRWSEAAGFEGERPLIEQSLALGVGGFCIFGGTAHDVHALTSELRARSGHPLLIAADLERGAGQQFAGCTQLPPLAAIGALDDESITARAAAITAREARAVGVNWLYAPVADVDLEPRNPIVGTRAFGEYAAHVARHVVAWVRAAQAQGVLCCVKHFPGHGRTVDDSHASLPHVHATAEQLETDLLPFRAAAAAGVASMMTAHVAYDAWDPERPATLSRTVLHTVLRERLGFTGIIVTDALDMRGVLDAAGGQGDAARAALRAGCDALLYPTELARIAEAIDDVPEALAAARRVDEAARRVNGESRRMDEAARVREDAARRAIEAPRRMDEAARGAEDAARRADEAARGDRAVSPYAEYDAGRSVGRVEDRAWADGIARRCCVVLRGTPALRSAAVTVVTLDDDLGGPHPPPSRDVFPDALRRRGLAVHTSGDGGHNVTYSPTTVLAVYADIRAWKGRPGLSAGVRHRLHAFVTEYPEAIVILFAHPRLLDGGLPARHVLAAWGGEAVMQRAAADWLTNGRS